jgi:hypothetical protein
VSAAALALAMALATAPEATERFLGVARLEDGRVAYREAHVVRLRDGRVASAETRYLDEAGRPFARLTSDYQANPFAPDYEFQDLRSGAREALRRDGEGVALEDGDRVRRIPDRFEHPLVAGQGLDRYARAHLAELARGEVLRVELALPGRLDTYAFRLRGERAEGGALRVRIEPESFVLRLLAPSLEADYDPATGRLLRYRGVSNVTGPDGESQKVEIAYSYLDSSGS